MRYIPISELYSEVLTFAPAAPVPLVERAIIDMAVKLCKTVPVWRDRDEISFLHGDESEYVCGVPSAIVNRIEAATFNGQALTPVRPAELDALMPDWERRTEPAAAPQYIVQLHLNTFRIVPFCAGQLHVRTILQPARDADQLPDFIIEHYGSMIGKAAAGQVLCVPSMDFSNPNLGAALLQGFNDEITTTVSVNVAKTQARARLRTKPNKF